MELVILAAALMAAGVFLITVAVGTRETDRAGMEAADESLKDADLNAFKQIASPEGTTVYRADGG